MTENGPVTEERVLRLIDHVYATDAIERKAEFFQSDAWSDPQAHFDVEFCAYLDLAMPIDPSDPVTPNQANDGKLYWMDHILGQGEHLADRQRYGADEIEQQAGVVEQPRSEKLRERLAVATETDRNVRWRDRLIALGGTAVFAAAEVAPLPELGTEAGIVAGGGALILTGLRWTGRKLSLMELREGVKNAERDEALQAMLPTVSSNVTVSQASKGLQYELETLELVGLDDIYNALDGDMAIGAILRDLDWVRLGDSSVSHLYWLTKDLTSLEQDRKKYNFCEKRFEIMAQLLNKYLPIDQEADTVTPVDEFSGEKTWQKYAEMVATGTDDISLEKLDAIYLSRFVGADKKSK